MSNPIIYKTVSILAFNYSFLFGLIAFKYTIEDLRPDLEDFNPEHNEEIEKLDYKYKHSIVARFFHKKMHIIIRSITSGSRWVNNEKKGWGK